MSSASLAFLFLLIRRVSPLPIAQIPSSHNKITLKKRQLSLLSCKMSLNDNLPSKLSDNSPAHLEWVEYSQSRESEYAMDHNQVESENPPVILLHGLLGSKRNFSSIGTALSRQLVKKKRRVLALDLRNHGENDVSSWRDSMSYGEMARDVLHFLDESGIKKAVFVGHSMGGKVAQALALLYPNRVDGLIVLDIAPVSYDREKDGSWKAVNNIIDALSKLQLENTSKRELDIELKKGGIEDVALRSFVLTNLEEDREKKLMHWKINLKAISEQMHVLAGFDLQFGESSNAQYHGDAFFINGGASRFIRSNHMSYISRYFPNHMLTTIRGAGHWVHAEAPDDTVALLKRYLER